MADQNSIDKDEIKFQPLTQAGLLDQFNLPHKATRFIRRNLRVIWLTAVAVVIAILAGAGFSTWREYREEKAATALDLALAAKQDNRQLLEQVIAEYGSTSASLWAQIELAFLTEKDGLPLQAIDRLGRINAGLATGSPLKSLVLTKLAGLYENQRQFDKAIALNTELAASGDDFAAAAYRSLGRLHEQLGKKEEAIAMYNKYLELTAVQTQPGQPGTNPMRDMVQSRLSLLKK